MNSRGNYGLLKMKRMNGQIAPPVSKRIKNIHRLIYNMYLSKKKIRSPQVEGLCILTRIYKM